MDFKTQTNQQPQSQAQPVAQQVSRPVPGATDGKGPKGGNKLIALLAGAVVLVVLAVVGLFVWQAKDGEGSTTSVEKDKYQAVFMTNGQVYFGKLDKLSGDYSELTDVYYLQVQEQNIQPETNKTATGGEQPQVSLTKLGNELHGPTDKMHIASEQILFWENLKDDSTVVKAIKDYQDKQ